MATFLLGSTPRAVKPRAVKPRAVKDKNTTPKSPRYHVNSRSPEQNTAQAIQSITVSALFVAASMVTSFIQIPILPIAPYLSYDPSGVICLLAGLLFSPRMAAGIAILSWLPHLFLNPLGFIIGVLSNLFFAVPASLLYRAAQNRKKKQLRNSVAEPNLSADDEVHTQEDAHAEADAVLNAGLRAGFNASSKASLNPEAHAEASADSNADSRNTLDTAHVQNQSLSSPAPRLALKLLPALAAGLVLSALVCCLANLLVTPLYLNAPLSQIAPLIIPIVLPFNLIKLSIHSVLGMICFPAAKKIAAQMDR